MKISQATGNNCAAWVISTMRLALGYETGLPDNWKWGSKESYELATSLGDCFPNRMVIIACGPKELETPSLLG